MKPNLSDAQEAEQHGLWHRLRGGLGWRYRRWIGHLRALARRVARKAPDRYLLGTGGYDAARYWSERHRKHLHGFRGVGDLSRTETENVADYVSAADQMADLLRAAGCDPRGKSMLDIGCGNGFWAGVFLRWGIASYTGIDITEALFRLLRKRFPRFRFICGDLRSIALNGEFNLVTMIDVTQHIVEDATLERMLARARALLAEDGVLVVTFWNQERPQEDFYEKFRSFGFYTRALDGMAHKEPMRFRDKFIAAFYSADRTPDGTAVEPLPRAAVLEVAAHIARV